jgi:HPr kinase/phosphorylase
MKPSLTVANLMEKADEYRLQFQLVAGKKGTNRKITETRIEEPGLGLAGYIDHILPGSILALTATELSYLSTLSAIDRTEALRTLCKIDIAALVVTGNLSPLPVMTLVSNETELPLLVTNLPIGDFITRCRNFLEDVLAPTVSTHGVLMDVFGIGIAILGKSGIGKSECALELIMRGHRFVADDVIEIQKLPPANLYGGGADLIRYHMEIRGLGIINIKSLFGISSIRERKKIQHVVELLEWDSEKEYDRLGFDDLRYTILDVELPLIQLPVRPGRNIAAIIEVAARNHLLKMMGYDSAREFEKHLSRELGIEHLPSVIQGDDGE